MMDLMGSAALQQAIASAIAMWVITHLVGRDKDIVKTKRPVWSIVSMMHHVVFKILISVK